MACTTRLQIIVSLFIIALTQLNGSGHAVRVQTEPQTLNVNTARHLTITCTGEGPHYWAKTVIGIQLMKVKENEDDSVIGSVSAVGITMGPGTRDDVKAFGKIDNDASRSFLVLVIDDPGVEDTGSYKCQVVFLDERLWVSKETVTVNVTFNDQNITDVADLVEKFSRLVAIVDELKDDSVIKRQQINTLKIDNSVQKEDIDDLKDFVETQNVTIVRQKQQLQERKEDDAKILQQYNILMADNIRQKKENDEIRDLIGTQNETLDELTNLVGTQNETIDKLTNLVGTQKDALERQKKRVQQLENDCTEKRKQLDTLKGDNSRQEEQLSVLKDLVIAQNETIRRLAQHLSRYIRLAHKQDCIDRGWTYYDVDQTCLKVFAIKDAENYLSWPEAREVCQSFGGDLAMISNEDKNNFVADTVAQEDTVWIGVRRVGEKFEFLDGSPISDNFGLWYEGEPNNSGGTEDCGQLYANMYGNGWNDQACSVKHAYVCSIRADGDLA